MPRVYLTKEQRETAADRDYLEQLSKGLRIYQALHRLNAVELSQEINLNYRTLKKLLDIEPVHIPACKLRKVMEAAGMGLTQLHRREVQFNASTGEQL